MALALLVTAIVVRVWLVFRLLVTGWARPWAERYLRATARREPKPSDQDDDQVLTTKEIRMGQGQPDTTGAGLFRRPRWICTSEGNPSWSSRQPTMEQARTEAAEVMGVHATLISVEAWDNALPQGEGPAWIDPLKE